jgi:hypothetical protein
VSAEVATIENDGRAAESERLLDASARQVLDLLKETVRLTVHAAGMELADAGSTPRNGPQPQSDVTGHAELLRRAREIELEISDLQADVAAVPGQSESFGPAEYLRYRSLLGKLRGVARAELPAAATVVVISKGDDELLDLGVRRAWHFPQDAHGGYAGHYPESSATAIAQLEELRSRGAEYLLVPATASWWLERYPEFGRHVRNSYTLVVDESEICSIYSLGASGT